MDRFGGLHAMFANAGVGIYAFKFDEGLEASMTDAEYDYVFNVHMKDRKTPANGGDNMPWGQGDTPLAELLQLIQRNGWTMPATIELEYPVPEGSTRAAEIGKCVEYCRQALA